MGAFRSSFQAIALGTLLAISLSYLGVPSQLVQLPILSLLFSPSSSVAYDPSTNITYHGISTHGVDHFYNIFYAHDTSGPNRFAPPIPLHPTPHSVIDATIPGAVCPQGEGEPAFPFTSPTTNTSENCLSVRIARPAGLSAHAKLPVLVYIHGGGNALGTATDQLYNPDGLIRQAQANGQPVLLVGMNYRLGIFGYATNKALRDARSANVGLRDQRAAFEWVRENIAAFGGDPGRVTAVGQSVGASSLGLHLTSFRGEKGVPFDQAILMSGASGLNFNIMSDLVANNTATIAQTLGCTDDFDSAATTQCLRDIPLQKLTDESVSFARRLRPPFGELSFYPSYDGDYIQDRPSQLLKHGHFAKGIPLIASWVTNDGAWYPPPTVNDSVSAAASFATFVPGLTLASQQRILDAYPPSDFDHLVPAGGFPTAQYYRAAQINRDLWFTCPVVDFTWHYARKGNAVSDVRLYEFNTTRFGPVYEAIGVPFWRAAHLSDIPYVLNNDAVAGGADNSAPQRALSRRMSGSIAAFAHTGEPTASEGGDVLGDWPPAYEGSGQEELGREYPGQMNVRVIGGPYGDGNAAMQRGGVGEVSGRQRAVEWERLFERCELLSSLSEEIGV